MQLPSGVVVGAVASGLAAIAGTSVLIFSTLRRTGDRRRAHLLLASGVVLATLTAVTGLVGIIGMAGHWSHHQHQRMTLATVVAVGLAASGLVLCAGLLRLPGVARTRSAALRLVLDGLVIGAALWFVGWVLAAEPTRLLGDWTPRACPAILLASATAAGAIGLTFVVGVRSPRPRRELVLIGSGVTLVGLAGLGLAVGICQAGPVVALTGAAVLPVGFLLIFLGGRTTERAGEVDADLIRNGTGYAFLPMLAMAVSAMYHLLRMGDFTVLGIVSGSVEGFALVARQSLALRDVRAYARRLAEREAHFRELAHTDPLTGLANRRGLLRALQQGSASAAPCVLLGLDLDGFKNVNDLHGHDVGDAVLAEVAQRLRLNLRPGDLAARLGGDEFAVLMWARPPEAQRVAERLLGILGRPYDHPAGRIFVSVSVGVAAQSSAPEVETLLRNADLALRYAKQRGKNRVERYDVAYDHLLRRRTTLEHEMRGAIERNELHLVFQPVVAVPSVRPVGAEALLRWYHPELGSVRPDEFIPLAEECGMIAPLGSWVLHQACHQLSIWLADGHDVWLSVNVSPRELHAPEYVVQVAEALRAHRVPPQRLVLEVTEHAVATDLDELIRRLAALRATGVRIALDDFGAGYSSLGQLRKLPIDILKIDHSLVAEQEPIRPPGEGERRVFAPMVDVVMRLGHQLGLEVIAEGVTNPLELAAVVEAGCRFGQGQLFGWGVPAEHLEAMLDAATSPGARAVPAPRNRSAQNLGSVDSSHEMRQA
ncbi:putative bifunctional diguanylate cyclase/phosphodiesterase [Micromonospora sp. NBC_01796]|uniref:putative bifunctional diguanylate cyclase/phosphodiesterase n=1 Tax=Micromonospora sp. NBC_01796 TaxID=2975987 RepID=UPI002DD9AC1D|nr:EAL domain-containing protein [Micromonospora sp. NBC_01796]WSA87189.1 EAL domain-containing protein [Micromonospora sp. NBC_01796]